MIRLTCKSNFKKIIYLYTYYLIKTLKNSGNYPKISTLPKKTKRLTILKSPHVNKKARDQYEINTYSVIITWKPSNDISFYYNLLKNKPLGVNIKLDMKSQG
jgi:small subunit ribosomal protein S10